MAKVKNSNKKAEKIETIDRKATLSLVVNFCSMFMLVFVIGLLVLANMIDKGTDLPAASESACECVDKTADEPAVLFPVSAGDPNEGSIQLVVDDSGYRDKELILSAEGAKMLQITNKGVNPHSFVVDGMLIDSGAIQPGEIKTIALESLSSVPQNYTFYSNLDGD